MDKKISKNYIYNLIYQILLLIVPLFVTPYIARVLGAELIGAYSYTQSIVSYFVLFGSLGINMYAQREIAYVQNDKEKRSQTFWEILILRGITVGCSLLLYMPMIVIYDKYILLFCVQIIDIFAVSIDITWYFQGIEDFKSIIVRNVIVKILSIFSIFVFVKTKDDILLYIAIIAISNFIGNITLWGYIPKYINEVNVKQLCLIKHLRGSMQLFLPQIAIQIYLVIDKTMLGLMSSTTVENGYYEQAQKIVKMLLAIITSLGTVMTSRIAALYAQKQLEKIREYIMKSFRLVFFLGVPVFFGLIGIADIFVPLFLGFGYTKVIILIKIFSLLIIFIGLSNVAGAQLLLPIGAQKKVTYTVLIGAITNLVLNGILIPSYYSIGAAIASVITEGMVMFLQLYCVREIINLKEILLLAKKYVLSGIVMLFILKQVNKFVNGGIGGLIVLVLAGVISYFGILMILSLPKNGEKNVI